MLVCMNKNVRSKAVIALLSELLGLSYIYLLHLPILLDPWCIHRDPHLYGHPHVQEGCDYNGKCQDHEKKL